MHRYQISNAYDYNSWQHPGYYNNQYYVSQPQPQVGYPQLQYPAQYNNGYPVQQYHNYQTGYYYQPPHYCPNCGNSIYMVYPNTSKSDNKGIGAVLVGVLVLMSIDILILRGK
ncbi:MAG TPA: hypothetical protein VNU93_09250 [Verrucomicrobiae bacterium]|nr:hypothetical protein [Verrucomicrobiae bacterium]